MARVTSSSHASHPADMRSLSNQGRASEREREREVVREGGGDFTALGVEGGGWGQRDGRWRPFCPSELPPKMAQIPAEMARWPAKMAAVHA
eukprot:533021-Rhodomonas_salina.1